MSHHGVKFMGVLSILPSLEGSPGRLGCSPPGPGATTSPGWAAAGRKGDKDVGWGRQQFLSGAQVDRQSAANQSLVTRYQGIELGPVSTLTLE